MIHNLPDIKLALIWLAFAVATAVIGVVLLTKASHRRTRRIDRQTVAEAALDEAYVDSLRGMRLAIFRAAQTRVAVSLLRQACRDVTDLTALARRVAADDQEIDALLNAQVKQYATDLISMLEQWSGGQR